MSELPSQAAVAIVGGGVMGVSTAYHLALRGQRDVVVLERDELFGQGATGKCAGGIRHQFGSEVNIRLSQASIRKLEAFAAELGQDVDLRWPGYLFLITRESDLAVFQRNVALQHRLGVATRWLTPADIARRVPSLDLQDVLAGTFYGHDGLADPSSVVNGYVAGARRLGATLLTETPVTELRVDGNRVTTVVTPDGEIRVEAVVNAAGPYAGELGRLIGLDLPIKPLRRQMLVTGPLAGAVRLPLCGRLRSVALLPSRGGRLADRHVQSEPGVRLRRVGRPGLGACPSGSGGPTPAAARGGRPGIALGGSVRDDARRASVARTAGAACRTPTWWPAFPATASCRARLPVS